MSLFRSPFVLQAVGFLGLFNLAVAHPLFEVLAGSPEFFAARRASATDLWLFAAALSLALPGLAVALIGIVRRLWAAAADMVQASAVGVLAAALALQALERFGVERALPALAGAALVGVATAAAYGRRTAVRNFVALLGPAALAVPLFFLGRPAIRAFTIVHDGPPVEYATAPLKTTPPIVLIVFDQLPLVSLLDAGGRIDGARYPAFAALAEDSTWFRNATAVSALTGWALPPILTGQRPRQNAPPIAAAYPNNLFTFLGRSYDMHVVEPITGLCPASLCPPLRDPLPARLAAAVLDAAVVYLHVVAPRELEAALPPVNQNWENFMANRRWQQRWIRQRDADRRDAPERFIESIRSGGARPALYFLHTLLPHEPYVYGRTGQAVSTVSVLPGLEQGDRWGPDEWLVVQNYQAHLVQVAYVDTLLGRIVARLKAAGVYDEALVVVTSDHGASFRPGQPFKGLTSQTAADIMAVPLLVKRPGQHTGTVSDRSVETLDVAPTIASVLGAALPWEVEGIPAFDGSVPPHTEKVAFTGGGRFFVQDPGAVRGNVRASVLRKLSLFKDGNPHAPLRAPHPELVGRELAGVAVADARPGAVSVDDAFAFLSVDPAADYVPARLTGQVSSGGGAERAALAVAVNGLIRATTLAADGGRWSALVPLAAFSPGRNDVRVFVIDNEAGGPVLHPAFESRRPPELDLVSGAAKYMWGVQQSGLHAREFRGAQPFYWTNGAARLVAPLDPEASPSALRIVVGMTSPRGTELTVVVDGCELFRGRISGRWSTTLPFDSCTPTGRQTTIELLSGTFMPGGGDTRTLGVALEQVILVSGS